MKDSNIPYDSLTCVNHSVLLRIDSVALCATNNYTEIHRELGRTTEIKLYLIMLDT